MDSISALEVQLSDAEFAASKARKAEASNAKIMDAFAQSRDEALADLAAAQVQARMDLQAMKAERDAALVQVAKRYDFIVALTGRIDSAEAEALALRVALCLIYDKWDAGTSCCDEGGAALGNALRLDKAEEDSILALIPTSRDAAKVEAPRDAMATSIAAQIEAGSPGPK